MRTMVYVDAFNLYFGSLRKTPYKWLNISELCQKILRPANVIAGIKYFIATIQARDDDPDRTTRQQVYRRALRTLLASHLLVDAFENRYDCAVLISGDSDLEAPVKFVKDKFKKVVGIINPQQRKCYALQTTAHFYKHIRPHALARCQFPAVLQDSSGSFNKPAAW